MVVVVVQLLQVPPCFSCPFGPLVSVVIVVWPSLAGFVFVLVFPPEPWVDVLLEALPNPVLLPAAKAETVVRANAAAAVAIQIFFIGYSTRAGSRIRSRYNLPLIILQPRRPNQP